MALDQLDCAYMRRGINCMSLLGERDVRTRSTQEATKSEANRNW